MKYFYKSRNNPLKFTLGLKIAIALNWIDILVGVIVLYQTVRCCTPLDLHNQWIGNEVLTKPVLENFAIHLLSLFWIIAEKYKIISTVNHGFLSFPTTTAFEHERRFAPCFLHHGE